MSNRRISVYDVTGLRVHPDGRRVDPTANNPRSRYWAPGATQDDQGNWIAVDAGGSLHVPRYSKRKRTGFECEEEEDAFEGLDGEESDDGYRKETTPKKGGKEGDTGKGKMRVRVGKDKGPQYRKRFKKDESYLGAGRSRSGSVPPDMPSQELLKAIHHFTANHYAENGFLHNSSKQYRIRKKKRREAKRAAERKAEGIDVEASTSKAAVEEDEDNSGSDSERDSDDGSDQEGSPSNSDGLNPLPIDPPEPGSSKIRGPGRPKRSKQYRDMYRVFDGTALMAIGILCQEYVRHLVKAPTTPLEHQEEGSTTKRKRRKKGKRAKPSSMDATNENILPNGEGPSEPSHADNGETQSDEVLPNLGPSSWSVNTYPINVAPK